ARRDLLDAGASSGDDDVLAGPLVRTLFAGQEADGGFGCRPYTKWQGAHWRLVSLVELGVPAREPRAVAAARTVIDWLCEEAHRSKVPMLRGRARAHASVEGNAL